VSFDRCGNAMTMPWPCEWMRCQNTMVYQDRIAKQHMIFSLLRLLIFQLPSIPSSCKLKGQSPKLSDA
jgi:hypothetical protein